MRKTRTLAAAAVAAAALAGIGAGSASAACVSNVCTDTQVVAGTPLSTLALGVPAPAIIALTNFGPGHSATGTGTVVVTSTQGWTLKVGDSANGGHLKQDPLLNTACPASAESQTANQLNVTSTGLSASSAGAVAIGSSPTTIATGAVTDTLTNAFSLLVGAGEPMSTGCVYDTTLTYTLQ